MSVHQVCALQSGYAVKKVHTYHLLTNFKERIRYILGQGKHMNGKYSLNPWASRTNVFQF